MFEQVLAFRGLQHIVESFDPTSGKTDYPDIIGAASHFKRASQVADALRDHQDDPAAQKQLWQAHRDKRDAQALLLGRTIVDFPHLSVEDALHVAGRHIKRGNMRTHEHIAVLSDFHGARDHNEHGVSFNTPYRNTRAEAFSKSIKHHYPNMQITPRELSPEGLTLIHFPNGEHMTPPPPPELEPEAPMDQPPEAQQ